MGVLGNDRVDDRCESGVRTRELAVVARDEPARVRAMYLGQLLGLRLVT